MTERADRIVVVGVGLIGASLAGALRSRSMASLVVGVGRSRENLDVALSRGFIDEAYSDLSTAVVGADLIVLAAPVDTSRSLLGELARAAPADCTITDAGSVKAAMLGAAVEAGLADRFVGAHPMAGGTATGAAAAVPDLFEGCTTVIVPGAAQVERVADVKALWSGVGAKVIEMEASDHDRVVARASHLPQMLSYALAAALGRGGDRRVLELAGNGLRDTTRLAASDAAMWKAIAAENRTEILAAMDDVESVWEQLRRAIDDGDGATLERIIHAANNFRRELETK